MSVIMLTGKYVDLIDVYSLDGIEQTDASLRLYELLKEREGFESISHKRMPSIKEHFEFIDSIPYKYWFLINNEEQQTVGAIYLTDKNEIGVGIFKDHRRKGYARGAIEKLILEVADGGPFHANINPENQKSIDLFESMGFKQSQLTLTKP
jgi:RimJ/RimL family protein N-acetyltransferase